MIESAVAGRSALVPTIGLTAAAVGAVATCAFFVVGSSYAFTYVGAPPRDDSTTRLFAVLFLVSTALVVTGLVFGIIGLARRRQPVRLAERVTSAVAILIALLPTVGFLLLVAINVLPMLLLGFLP